MRRRDVILLLGAAVIARPPAASAQRSDRVSRIGVLHVLPQQSSLGFVAFRERLGELGYVEGRNIAVEYRWSDQPERLPALAAELTASNVHVRFDYDESCQASDQRHPHRCRSPGRGPGQGRSGG
jgi:putative tryptophan/tyrosine transport system substrate-binding protein